MTSTSVGLMLDASWYRISHKRTGTTETGSVLEGVRTLLPGSVPGGRLGLSHGYGCESPLVVRRALRVEDAIFEIFMFSDHRTHLETVVSFDSKTIV